MNPWQVFEEFGIDPHIGGLLVQLVVIAGGLLVIVTPYISIIHAQPGLGLLAHQAISVGAYLAGGCLDCTSLPWFATTSLDYSRLTALLVARYLSLDILVVLVLATWLGTLCLSLVALRRATTRIVFEVIWESTSLRILLLLIILTLTYSRQLLLRLGICKPSRRALHTSGRYTLLYSRLSLLAWVALGSTGKADLFLLIGALLDGELRLAGLNLVAFLGLAFNGYVITLLLILLPLLSRAQMPIDKG